MPDLICSVHKYQICLFIHCFVNLLLCMMQIYVYIYVFINGFIYYDLLFVHSCSVFMYSGFIHMYMWVSALPCGRLKLSQIHSLGWIDLKSTVMPLWPFVSLYLSEAVSNQSLHAMVQQCTVYSIHSNTTTQAYHIFLTSLYRCSYFSRAMSIGRTKILALFCAVIDWQHVWICISTA